MEMFDIWDPEGCMARQPGRGSNSVFFREGKFPAAAVVGVLNVEGQRNRRSFYLAERRRKWLLIYDFFFHVGLPFRVGKTGSKTKG